MAQSTLVDFYKVKSTDTPVQLEVIIGFAQAAISSVRIDKKKINSDFKGGFQCALGKNQDLDMRNLFITTVVHDISKQTNNTSVTIKLSGGVKCYTALMKQTVIEDGGVSTYAANIEFYM